MAEGSVFVEHDTGGDLGRIHSVGNGHRALHITVEARNLDCLVAAGASDLKLDRLYDDLVAALVCGVFDDLDRVCGGFGHFHAHDDPGRHIFANLSDSIDVDLSGGQDMVTVSGFDRTRLFHGLDGPLLSWLTTTTSGG